MFLQHKSFYVVVLANAHLKSLEYLNNHKCVDIFNSGVGIRYSVLDIVNTFSKANNVEAPYVIK